VGAVTASLDYALHYAAQGFRVFPVFEITPAGACACGKAECPEKSWGKHPRIGDHLRAATHDVATVSAWWAQWPTANIGIVTGKGSGLVVIDIDAAETHDGKDGLASLASLPSMPRTFMVATGGKGYHLYFRAPDLYVGSGSGKLGIGIDHRGENGYVLAPPSNHRTGGVYRIEDDAPIADLPEWVIAALAKPKTPERPAGAPDLVPARAPHPIEVARAKAVLRAVLDKLRAVPVDSGSGRDVLNWAAFTAGGLWPLPPDGVQAAIYAVVRAEWDKPFDPPGEVERIVNAGFAKGQECPLDLAVDPDLAALGADLATVAPGWTPTEAMVGRIGTGGAKLPTGFESLDTATRGGLRMGRLVVIGGAPGAGKTGVAIQLARRFAHMMPVLVLAADEEPEGLLMRFGQMAGIEREALEEDRPGAKSALVAALRASPRPFEVVDASEPGATIENAAQALALRGPGLLVVDSLQTAKSAGWALAGDNAIARIDANVAALKDAAKRWGHLVLATSELGRGAYRNADNADNVDLLSAFKGSGSIEYAATVLLVLRSIKDAEGVVECAVPKNRLGGAKPTFTLAHDPLRAQYHEAAQGPTFDFSAPLRERVLNAVRGALSPLSKNAVVKAVGGRKEAVGREVDRLVEEGALRSTVKGTFILAGSF
jgi:KaiC/GvpD/RAD55 family RecA-like ATPase